MDRFLNQFKLVDLIGYMIPGMVVFVGLWPVMPSELINRYQSMCEDGVPAWALLVLAAYPTGFVTSLTADGVLRKVMNWEKSFSIRFNKGKQKKGSADENCVNIHRHLGAVLEASLQRKLGINLEDCSQMELRELAEALTLGTAAGDELHRVVAMNRFAVGLAGALLIVAVGHWLLGGWLIVTLMCGIAAMAACWTCKGDSDAYFNQTVTSGIVALLSLGDPDGSNTKTE